LGPSIERFLGEIWGGCDIKSSRDGFQMDTARNTGNGDKKVPGREYHPRSGQHQGVNSVPQEKFRGSRSKGAGPAASKTIPRRARHEAREKWLPRGIPTFVSPFLRGSRTRGTRGATRVNQLDHQRHRGHRSQDAQRTQRIHGPARHRTRPG